MIGIQAIGIYVPAGRIDNRQRMTQFEVDECFLRDKSGMLRLAVKAENEETSDLCCQAFADLQRQTPLQPDAVECIVVCTQNPDGHGLPHTSSAVHAKLGLPQACAAFDISLGCSGFVYGLSVIQGFMQSNGIRRGVLFTADPYSKVIDERDKGTSLLFGDAATATLVSDAPVWRTGKFLFGSHGQERASIQVEEGSGKLSMNGRAVFSFSATVVPRNIAAMLAANHLAIEDIDCFALHQGSRYIVETIRKKLGIAEDKAPFVAADYGNTVSSSIPIMLGNAPLDSRRIVIAGFGVGLSWASTVLHRVEQGNVSVMVTPEEIVAVIKDVGVTADVSKIKGDTPLSGAGIDSLEMMNVFLGIEEKYGVKIPDEDISVLRTVNDIVSYLKRQ